MKLGAIKSPITVGFLFFCLQHLKNLFYPTLTSIFYEKPKYLSVVFKKRI